MQVIFRGDPVELARGEGLSRVSLNLWDVHFPMGVPVDVSHLSADQQNRLRRNGHFEVVAAAPAPAPAEAVAEGENGSVAVVAQARAAKPKGSRA